MRVFFPIYIVLFFALLFPIVVVKGQINKKKELAISFKPEEFNKGYKGKVSFLPRSKAPVVESFNSANGLYTFDYSKVTDSQVSPISVDLKIFWDDFDDEKVKEFKLVIPEKFLLNSFELKAKSKTCRNSNITGVLKIEYEVQKNGKNSLNIPFAISTSQLPCSKILISKGSFTFNYEIKGWKSTTQKTSTNPSGDLAEKKDGDNQPPSLDTSKTTQTKAASDEKKKIAQKTLSEWRNAQKEDKLESYKRFLSRNPNSRYNQAARKRIVYLEAKIDPSYKKLGAGHYQFQLKNAVSPRIDSIVPMGGIEIDSIHFVEDFTFNVKVLDGRKHKIYVYDSGKPKFKRHYPIPVRNSEMLFSKLVDAADTVKFDFTGGRPPYLIIFKQEEREVYRVRNISSATHKIPKSLLREKHLKDTLTVEIWDSQLTFFHSPGFLKIDSLPPPWSYFYIGVAVLSAILLFLFTRFFLKRRKHEKLEELNRQRKKTQMDLMGNTSNGKVLPTTKLQREENPILPGRTLKIIRIRKARQATPVIEANQSLASAITAKGYYPIDMEILWKDSKVVKIGFSKHGIQNLDQFLRSKNVDYAEETEGTITEIGGFLMGNYFNIKGINGYYVTVEEFIPVSAKFNNIFQLEFSTNSLVKELGDSQDKFPELSLVGWFHTHPGHGLFLSKPDLTIHEGFFQEPYQFAMEIDSLTENLDTAFFTRDKNGNINNQDRLLPGVQWFSWTDIEKFTRRKN